MQSGFSYRRFFRGDTLMVIVPHEDDEINIAGTVIDGARAEGMRVICVFVTNGDYQYIPEVRLNEAVQALAVLGVPEEDIVFLGYPDGGAHAERSVFIHGQTKPVVINGRMETCGTPQKAEFCMKEWRIHHTWTWDHLLLDLRTVILKYAPEGIIAVDFEKHPDHRMVSMAFEKAMSDILNRSCNAYQPVVLKAFAYNTAFEGVQDFYQSNLLSAKINPDTLLLPGQMDNPGFEWGERLRFPVPEACRTQDLGKNKMFRALTCHMSQKAMRRAERLINGDQVFWQKRTDNLCFMGRVTVSSGEGKYLHDFQTINTRDIAPPQVTYEEYLWIPDSADRHPWCRCDFLQPQDIGIAGFWGNLKTDGSRILRGRLSFSNGYAVDVGPIPDGGQRRIVRFPQQKSVRWVQFDILEKVGDTAGLAEWELFSGEEILPLLKICVNGEFAYEWLMKRGQDFSLAAYNPSGKSLRWYANGKPVTLAELNELGKSLTEPLRVRVEWITQPEIWDEALLLPDTLLRRLRKKRMLLRSRLISWWENQKEKRPHHKLKKFQNKSTDGK